GEDLAIVSDAGTPLLSDPGARIVQAVIAANFEIVPVPGASALLSALVASGLEPEPFTFFGFLERSGRARKERLAQLAAWPHTAVLYEAPGRVVKLLEDLQELCGPDRQVVVARELTKIHETFVRGTISAVREYYDEQQIRGEVVVLVAGAAPVAQADQEGSAREMARQLLAAGATPRDAAREIAGQTGVARNRAYEITLSVSREGPTD
ncbi:MAG TPA: 16S rRNA (cytidine(1402)-2'-O)-methyltransferase, partial [Longimicrobiales bacterium]